MKSEKEIKELFNSSYRDIEDALGIEILNGQHSEGIKAALNWVLDGKIPFKRFRIPRKSSLDYLRESDTNE